MSGTGRIVRGADLVPVPWPNGLGVTRDIAREVDAEGELLWLLTIADLERDAPFSHLLGRERIFTVVAGGPVLLTVGDDPPMRCRPFVPAYFPGDRPTLSRLESGPGRAFNVMVGRGRASPGVRAATLAAGQRMEAGPGTTAIFCAEGEVMVGEHTLRAGDTFLAEGERSLAVEAGRAPATVLLIEIALVG